MCARPSIGSTKNNLNKGKRLNPISSEGENKNAPVLYHAEKKLNNSKTPHIICKYFYSLHTA